MKHILFSTGNERKINEAAAACQPRDITVTAVKLEIDEIQSHDPLKTSQHKAETAFALAGKPMSSTIRSGLFRRLAASQAAT